MTHVPNYNKDDVAKLFEALGKDPYSYLWNVVGDFEINGHTVSIVDSKQFGHVIIDHAYVRINDYGVVIIDGQRYTPREYAMYKLGF